MFETGSVGLVETQLFLLRPVNLTPNADTGFDKNVRKHRVIEICIL